MEHNREPALRAGAVAAAVVALLSAYRIVTAEQALAWTTILTMALTFVVPLVQAWYTRQKVVPVATIEAAGLDPAKVVEAAADPNVAPHVPPVG